MITSTFLRHLFMDQRGSFAVETALITPLLIALTFGTFEIGTIVARQHQLQSATSEAATIALAAAQGATLEIETLREILADSTKVPTDNVVITRFYRCGDSATTVADPDACAAKSGSGTSTASASTVVMSSYLRIVLTDEYTPIWKHIGVGDRMNFHIERTVMLS